MESAERINPAELDLTKLDEALKSFEQGNESLLIPALQTAQNLYGYISKPVLERISEYLQVPLSRVYGVVTFYAQFRFAPTGKYKIKVCRGTACHVRGSKGILEALERELRIKDGETTPDLKFSLETVACLGTCFLAPVIMVNEKYFGKLTTKKIQEVLKQF